MKQLVLAGLLLTIPLRAPAQTPSSTSTSLAGSFQPAAIDAALATPTGHDVSANLAGYTYKEPGDQSISIHGTKFGGGYTGTFSLGARRRWFVQADGRGTIGNATYDGWCSPFLITPSPGSANGYRLTLGDAFSCSETGDRDWYVETRGLVGMDRLGRTWGVSPYTGLGLRHLSNGTNGTPGYRTDDYLYLPLGVTTRTRLGSRAMSVSLEYDRLIHGWQKTRDSKLGGGDVSPTSTAPGFTIDGFSDISFAQSDGWALRARAKYQLTRHWSIEPYYIHWAVGDSPVNHETVTFTVNNVTAQQQVGAYEPLNTTNEFSVGLGFHF